MNKVCSIFSQVLKLFSRGDFEKAVTEHKAERHARGFTSWGQFMAMLFCQLGRAHSLREICGGGRSSRQRDPSEHHQTRPLRPQMQNTERGRQLPLSQPLPNALQRIPRQRLADCQWTV